MKPGKRTRSSEMDHYANNVAATRQPEQPFPTLSDETLLTLFGCIPEPRYTFSSNGRRIVHYSQ